MERRTAVVIGSGFGGAVTAYRLAKAGVDTLVLERGRRWKKSADQPAFCTFDAPDGRAAWLSDTTVMLEPTPIEKSTGILERQKESGIDIFCGAGVGGGSLVYNGAMIQPDRHSFEALFSSVGADDGAGLEYERFDQDYFQRVRSTIGIQSIPDNLLKSKHYLAARLFLEMADKAGMEAFLTETAIDWRVVEEEVRGDREKSVIRGDCWYGINNGAKKSLDKNYIKAAEDAGAEIRALNRVQTIREIRGDKARYGYHLEVEVLEQNGERLRIDNVYCSYLFFAAGSAGTTRLLVKARDRGDLPRLSSEVGKGWSNNGDVFSSLDMGRRINGVEAGPCVSAARATLVDNERCTIVPYPDPAASDSELISMTMSSPDVRGKIFYDRASDETRLIWPRKSVEFQRMLDRSQGVYCDLQKFASGVETEAGRCSALSLPVVSAEMTTHPLGGACIGRACDSFGRIRGYDRMYVMDGALMPGSTAATNPSMTIAAFAERNMDFILATDID